MFRVYRPVSSIPTSIVRIGNLAGRVQTRCISTSISRMEISRGATPLSPEETLHLPRILCLHGGGVNAEIFRAQARALIRGLPDFRLVFADGPFFCDAGPGIVPVYEDCGPFRRWLRWLPEHPEVDDETAIEEIMYSIESCKRKDEGTGPWVGLMGFSQGAILSASLLYDQQIRLEKDGKADTDYKFGILLAGRAPLVSFSEYSRSPACLRPGTSSAGFSFDGVSPHVSKVPTLHVHGLADGGLHLHRKLLKQYHDPATATLIEWEGEHRVPIKKVDVDRITREIYRIAAEQDILF